MATRRIPGGWPAAMAVLATASLLGAGCSSGDAVDGRSVDATEVFDDCATETSGPAVLIGFDAATGEQQWTRMTGESAFAADAEGLLIALGTSGMTAYDAASGHALWCRPGSASPGPRPAIVDGLMAVTERGRAAAIDLHSGEERWSVPIQSGRSPEIGTDGSSFVYISGGPLRRPQEAPEMPFAVDARLDVHTGEAVEGPPERPWLQQQQGENVVTIEEPPEGGGFNVVVVSDPTGAERWRVSTPFTTDVLLDRDLVVISSLGAGSSRVTAYSVGDGSVLWAADADTPRIFAAGDLVLVDGPGSLTALAHGDGRELWSGRYENPGRGGRYTETGWFEGVAVSSDGGSGAGLLVAAEPYRD